MTDTEALGCAALRLFGLAQSAELNQSRALLRPVTDGEPSFAGGANVFLCSGTLGENLLSFGFQPSRRNTGMNRDLQVIEMNP